MSEPVLTPMTNLIIGPSADIRIKKLTGAHMVNVAAAHNKRERWSQQSKDPKSSMAGKNVVAWGPSTSRGVAEDARQKITFAGITKVRKNGVYAIELIATLKSGTGIDEDLFFNDCMTWVQVRFGGSANLLSADIHRDEAEPHMHLLVLPLVDGRLKGSDLVGGPGKFRGHRRSFSEEVCNKHGLTMGTRVLRGDAKRDAADWIFARLEDDHDSILSSAMWPPVRRSIKRDPEPFLAAVGGNAATFLKSVKHRTMVQIFTGSGKGPRQPKYGEV